MRVGIYFCTCGSSITEKIDSDAVRLAVCDADSYLKNCEFICSEEGKNFLRDDLLAEKPDRVVVAACSPREYEAAFREVLGEAGLNPYYLQMVNIREQVSWVTPDPAQATDKATALIRGAVARVRQHKPLEKTVLDVCGDVLVIGAGPAGLKATLTLAEAGRKVTLVESSPVLGGLPVRFEELFPAMECGPCLLEPVLGDVLHGKHSSNIEVLTLAKVEELVGYYGNFTARIRQRPRYVDEELCIGCGECIAPCPASTANEFNCGLDQRKAIAFPFAGALPNIPFLDWDACLRSQGEDCRLCVEACPVEGAVNLDADEQILERNIGAVVVAVGGNLYDAAKLPQLGYGNGSDVYTSLEFERILASGGPTDGKLLMRNGRAPRTIALVHCVGSLDENHCRYCSGVCCQAAFKYGHLIRDKAADVEIHHFFKELVMPGKEAFALYEHARHNAQFHRYSEIGELEVSQSGEALMVRSVTPTGESSSVDADIVVLCPAVTPADDTISLSGILDISTDRFGFFEELHGRVDSARASTKGLFIAGACQSPMDIQSAMSQGMTSAGYILAELVEGRQMTLEPIVASVNPEQCSACRICAGVCPYQAISVDPETSRSVISPVLCQGCGTCVAACPAGAITGNHFTQEQIVAEMEAILT